MDELRKRPAGRPPLKKADEAQNIVPASSDKASPHSELEQRVIEVLKTIFDPEIPVNIYDMGLIYEVKEYPMNNVYVRMTLTTPMCPVAQSLPQEVEEKVRGVEGVNDVHVELTFEPPWDINMMTEEARIELGLS